jgi:hypothetical protein
MFDFRNDYFDICFCGTLRFYFFAFDNHQSLKMQKNMARRNLRWVMLLVLALTIFPYFVFSQKTDSVKSVFHFGGSAMITNNGISLVPTFSLGKPAALFIFSMGGKRLSFEPDLRFSLEGKPWSFLFWWRYKLVMSEKFLLNAGVHPALNFKTSKVTINGNTSEQTVARRYIAAELSPNYRVAKNLSVGIYYLVSQGLDPGTTKHTHFLTINGSFWNIRLPASLFLRVTPQLYYLNMDGKDGFYFTATMTMARKNFPIFLTSTINQTIHTEITASKDFVWNLTLAYAFGGNFIKK